MELVFTGGAAERAPSERLVGGLDVHPRGGLSGGKGKEKIVLLKGTGTV